MPALNCLVAQEHVCLKSSQAKQQQNIEYFKIQFIPETMESDIQTNTQTNKTNRH